MSIMQKLNGVRAIEVTANDRVVVNGSILTVQEQIRVAGPPGTTFRGLRFVGGGTIDLKESDIVTCHREYR